MSKLNFICIDCSDPRRMADFWSAAMDGYTVDAQEWGVIMTSEAGPSVYFEVVPEGKAVKNRLHLNLAAQDRDAEVKRLIGLGASEVEQINHEGYSWTNMKDVEGNEFCVSQAQ